MRINDLKKITDEMPVTPKMPVLFLGHGSPMNAIEENEFVAGFRNIAQTLPKPTAILCISAHWYINKTAVTAMEMPKQIYDFGGFPKALYDVKYPALGSLLLANETKNTVKKVEVQLDETWGLDHGAWTVIKHLYPNADVPVVQMSIDYTKDAQFHFDLAKDLQALRSKGILIIGSGNIIHNLGLVDFYNLDKDNYGYDWAIESRAIMNQLIEKGDFKSLIQYNTLGKSVQLAIPTAEHYLPMIYSLGLKEENETLNLFNDKLLGGSLSMTSFKIG
ncbi:MAG: 4,5-DOPA dioxygenase extradiol [Bacteroidota bacterium]|nr:4,5-DOPA dioxygenase extradiol [Bacteroidota bacterium]